jgi:ribosomal protein S18 acetylase RimI-like enzyme
MNTTLHIRPARSGDADFVAKIMYATMGSLADYLFEQDVPAIEAALVKLFSRNAGRFGYRITVIAESAGVPVGMLVSCAGMELNRINLKTFPQFFPVLGFKRTIGFMLRGVTLPGGNEAEKDEYYISNLGVSPSAQGRGFGSQLLAYAEQIALASGLSKTSLIVSSHNDGAQRLYERVGYRTVETVPDQKEIPGYYRMVKVL